MNKSIKINKEWKLIMATFNFCDIFLTKIWFFKNKKYKFAKPYKTSIRDMTKRRGIISYDKLTVDQKKQILRDYPDGYINHLNTIKTPNC